MSDNVSQTLTFNGGGQDVVDEEAVGGLKVVVPVGEERVVPPHVQPQVVVRRERGLLLAQEGQAGRGSDEMKKLSNCRLLN